MIATSRPRRHARTRPVPHLALALVSLAAVSGLAACGDDDEGSVAAEACDAAVALDAAFAAAPQDPAGFGPYAEAELVPVADRLVEHLDGDAREAAEALRDVYGTIATTGDPAAMETPEAAEARAAVGAAIHDGCDLEAVEISAIEYAFVGAPAELPAGRVSFALANDGVEEHEMVLFQRAAGVTDTLEDLLALPEEEAFSKLRFTGVAFGAPGTTSHVAVDLTPGTYFLVCFIPQGGEDGPPHFTGGMQHTLTVT